MCPAENFVTVEKRNSSFYHIQVTKWKENGKKTYRGIQVASETVSLLLNQGSDNLASEFFHLFPLVHYYPTTLAFFSLLKHYKPSPPANLCLLCAWCLQWFPNWLMSLPKFPFPLFLWGSFLCSLYSLCGVTRFRKKKIWDSLLIQILDKKYICYF